MIVMNSVFNLDDELPDSDDLIAVALCNAYGGNLHAGLIYRDEAHVVRFLHLGWEDRLLDSRYESGIFILPNIEPEHAFLLATMCTRVWGRFCTVRKFPYGLRYEGTTFDATGKLVLGPGACGLTCATLVLALFKAIGFSLINEQSWPIRSDEDRQFLEAIRRYASPAHFAILEREIENGAKRIRPDEVAGASLLDWPAEFAPVRDSADKLVARLGDRER
jgi:hypothetical protein